MDSLFTDQSRRAQREQQPDTSKLEDFSKVFKGSLDILNSMNEISQMREKAGKVCHSYNVKKTNPRLPQAKRGLSRSKQLKLMRSKPTKHGNHSSSMPFLQQPIWSAKKQDLIKTVRQTREMRLGKVKEWKDPDLEEMYRLTLDTKGVDMYKNFHGTAALKTVKSEFYIKPYKKLAAIREKKSKNVRLAALNGDDVARMVGQSYQGVQREFQVKRGTEFDTEESQFYQEHQQQQLRKEEEGEMISGPSSPPQGDESQDYRLTSQLTPTEVDIGEYWQNDANSKSKTSQIKPSEDQKSLNNEKLEQSKEIECLSSKHSHQQQQNLQNEDDPNFENLFKTIPPSEKINNNTSTNPQNQSLNQQHQNFNPSLHQKIDIRTVKTTLDCVQDKQMQMEGLEKDKHISRYLNSRSRFDLIVNQDNLSIYEGYIKKISMMNAKFPTFFIKNLKDYNSYPLENYDVDRDKTLDIDFYIKHHPQASSRWFDSNVQKFVWEPCSIISYDPITEKFEIKWDRENSTGAIFKQVKKLNLKFENESSEELDQRREKSNFFRCMHLLRISLMNFMLGKEENTQTNVFFSYQRFKNILGKTGLTLEAFNANPEWMSHLEEMFDDFGISIVKFYIDWKTIENLEDLLEKYKIQSIHSESYGGFYEDQVNIMLVNNREVVEDTSHMDFIYKRSIGVLKRVSDMNGIMAKKKKTRGTGSKIGNRRDGKRTASLTDFKDDQGGIALFDSLRYFGLTHHLNLTAPTPPRKMAVMGIQNSHAKKDFYQQQESGDEAIKVENNQTKQDTSQIDPIIQNGGVSLTKEISKNDSNGEDEEGEEEEEENLSISKQKTTSIENKEQRLPNIVTPFEDITYPSNFKEDKQRIENKETIGEIITEFEHILIKKRRFYKQFSTLGEDSDSEDSHSHSQDNTRSSNPATSKRSSNIQRVFLVLKKSLFPQDTAFFFYRKCLLELIFKIEDINIFSVFNSLLKYSARDKQFGFLKFGEPELASSLEQFKATMEHISQETKRMCDELEPQNFNLLEFFSKRFQKLILVLNSEIQTAIETMLHHSVAQFRLSLRYMAIGIRYSTPLPSGNQSFDQLLPQSVFYMKYQAMVEFGRVPPEISESTTTIPECFPFAGKSPLQRRMYLLEKLSVNLFQNLSSNNLKKSIFKENIQMEMAAAVAAARPPGQPDPPFERFLLGSFQLIFSAPSRRDKKKDKKKGRRDRKGRQHGKHGGGSHTTYSHETIQATRDRCRAVIYNLEGMLKQDSKYLRKGFLNLDGYSTHARPREIAKTSHCQVVDNDLCDFRRDFDGVSLSPTLQECEQSIKHALEKTLSSTLRTPRVRLERFNAEDSSYQLEDLTGLLAPAVSDLDGLLAEAFLQVFAVLQFFSHFQFLLMASEVMLVDEVHQLIEKNELEPLLVEIKRLKEDYMLIKLKLPDLIKFGLWEFDVSSFRKETMKNIDAVISSTFMDAIFLKFDSLIVENRKGTQELKLKLVEDVVTIEKYIKMKEFLEGHELKTKVEAITVKIRLCKAIYELMCDFRVDNEHYFKSYLETLKWVTEIRSMNRRALRRLKESMPKFVKEIEIKGEKVFEEFEKLEIKIKKFDHNYEIEYAEQYCNDVKELNTQLGSVIVKAEDINGKQSYFKEYKPTSFERIFKTRISFKKYVQLWTFIQDQWRSGTERWTNNPFQELDHEEMGKTVNYGLGLLNRLKDQFQNNEQILEIIANKLQQVLRHHTIMDHVVILKHPCFKERHWHKLFEEMRRSDKNSLLLQKKPDLAKVTLRDLLNLHLLNHYDTLKKILQKAKKESETYQKILDIQKKIHEISIRPQVYDLVQSGLNFIPKVKNIIAELNDYHSQCSNMLTNRDYPEEFLKDLTRLSRIIEYSKKVLEIIYVLQNKLIRFSPIFYFNQIENYLTRKNVVGDFLGLRNNFMNIMREIETKKMNYFITLVGNGDNERINKLIAQLEDYDKTADTIYQSLRVLFKIIRVHCPRYFFLSEEQMLISCSLLKFASSLMGFVAKMFGGVKMIIVHETVSNSSTESVNIQGLKTKNGEVLYFEEELEIGLKANAEIPLITIVRGIEGLKHTYFQKQRVTHLRRIAEANFDFGAVWLYAREHKLLFQVVALFINIVFDHELQSLYAIAQQDSSFDLRKGLVKLKQLLTRNYHSFRYYPFQYMEGDFRNQEKVLFFNQYFLFLKYFEEKLDYLILSRADSMAAFEYQTLPRYSVSYDSRKQAFQAATGKPDPAAFLEATCAGGGRRLLEAYEEGKTWSGDCPILGQLYCQQNSDVYLGVMDIRFKYENEIVTYNRNLAIWPVCEKTVLTIFTALKLKQNMILKGGTNQGKSETIRIVSGMLAVNYIECETKIHLQEETVVNLLSGVIAGGYWINVKNLESCSLGVISTLATYAELIKQKMAMNSTRITLGTNDLLIKDNLAIFATFRVTGDEDERRFNAMPLTLLQNFRVINIAQPNYSLIIEHLISFVMPGQEAKSWANKVLLYSKMYKNIDNFTFMLENSDEKGNGKSKILKKSKLKQQQRQGMYKRSTTAHNLAKQQKKQQQKEEGLAGRLKNCTDGIDIDLRLISFILNVSTLFFFGKLEDYFREFDNDARYVYMNDDKSTIKVDFDRRNHFTLLFKKTLSLFFRKRGAHADRLRLFNTLFNKIFEEEISVSNPSPSKRFVYEKEALPGFVRQFLAQEKDPYFISEKKLISVAEDYLELLSRKPKGRQYIVYGEPDTQKSRFLKLLAFLESNIQDKNFTLFWLNMECLDNKAIFGSSQYVGILREIFLRCHNINMEENKTSNMKLNLLFQPSSVLYSEYADPRGQGGVKMNREINNGMSWVIIDSNSSKNNRGMFDLIQKQMKIVSTLNEHRVVNQYLGFSRALRFMYELNELSLFDPRSVSENHLIFMRESIVSLEERAFHWLSTLKTKNAFFGEEKTAHTLEALLDLVAVPYVQFLARQRAKCRLLYFTSEISLLNNFLSYYEIFLNELRKYLAIHELLEPGQVPSFLRFRDSESAFMFEDDASSRQDKRRELSKQKEGLNLLPSMRMPVRARAREYNQLAELRSAEDRDEFVRSKLEAICIFALSYSLSTVLIEDAEAEGLTQLQERISAYVTEEEVYRQKFGDGVNKLINSETMGGAKDLKDYVYDISRGLWIRWAVFDLGSVECITKDFSLDKFNRKELERLRCQNQKLKIQTLQAADSNDRVSLGPQDEIGCVDTQLSKTSAFFLHFFNAYNRHVLMVSDVKQGKSLAVAKVLKELTEQNKICSFNFGMQRSMTLEVVQKHIEDNLLKQGANIFAPPVDKKVVVWLDDLHLSMSISKPESLVRSLQVQGGWFSLDKFNFTQVREALFFMTLSIHENSIRETNRVLDSLNLDVLAKTMILKLKKASYQEFQLIYSEVLRPTVDLVAPEPAQETFCSLNKRLSKVLFFNKEVRLRLTNNQAANLDMPSFFALVRRFEMYDWEKINARADNLRYVFVDLIKGFLLTDISGHFRDSLRLISFAIGKKYMHELTGSQVSRNSQKSQPNMLSPMLPSLTNQKRQIKRRMSLLRKNSLVGQMPSDFETDGLPPKLDSPFGQRQLKLNRNFQSLVPRNQGLGQKQGQTGQTDLIEEVNRDEEESRMGSDEDDIDRLIQKDIRKNEVRNSLFKQQMSPGGEGDSKNKLFKSRKRLSVQRKSALAPNLQQQQQFLGVDLSKSSLVDKKRSSEILRQNYDLELINKFKNERLEPLTLAAGIKEAMEGEENSLSIEDGENESLDSINRDKRAQKKQEKLLKQKQQKKKNLEGKEEDSSEDEKYEIQGPEEIGGTTTNNKDKGKKNHHNSKKPQGELVESEDLSQGDKLPQKKEQIPSQTDEDLSGSTDSMIEQQIRNYQSESNSSTFTSSSSRESSVSSSCATVDINPANLELVAKYKVKEGRTARSFKSGLLKAICSKRMTKKQIQEEVSRGIFDPKLLYDMELVELGDADDSEKDKFVLRLSVVEGSQNRRLMTYFKDKLNSFIYQNPEAVFCLKLSGPNFPYLVNDVSSLQGQLASPFTHLYVSSFKSLLYSSYVLQIAAELLFCSYQQVDVLNHRSQKVTEEERIELDAYGYLIEVIAESMPDIWQDKRLVLQLHVAPCAVAQAPALLEQVFGLVDAVMFNTDLLVFHLRGHLKAMLESIKEKGRPTSSMNEQHIVYLLRRKIQAKVHFVILSEISLRELHLTTHGQRAAISGFRRSHLAGYLSENYPKLFTGLQKRSYNGFVSRGGTKVPRYYEKICPFSDVELTVIYAKASRIEMTYARILDSEFDFLPLLRPFGENLTLYEQVAKGLYHKFEQAENESENEGFIREQLLNIQKIRRRGELLAIERKEIEKQLALKQEEVSKILKTKEELMSNRAHFSQEKKNVELKLETLHQKIEGYRKEDQIFEDLEQKLKEASQNLLTMQEKFFLGEIQEGGFLSSKIFAIYAILFHEFFSIQLEGASSNLPLEALGLVEEKTLDIASVGGYVAGFARLLGRLPELLEYVASAQKEPRQKSLVLALAEIIQKSDDSGFLKWNETQKCVMKWVDLLIEWSRFGLTRSERKGKVAAIEETIARVNPEIEKRDNLVAMIDESLKEQPNLIKTVEAKISLFEAKKSKNQTSSERCEELIALLLGVHEKYARASQPFKTKDIKKEVMIELLATFVVFWSKYPYSIKRSLFLATIKSAGVPTRLFNSVPLFEILGSEQMLLEALKSKVPLNINVLNNVAISEFVMEALLPYPLLIDPAGLFLKWLRYRYSRTLIEENAIPSGDCFHRLEACLSQGLPYLVVDPGRELCKLIAPVIEWRFRRFCETLLAEGELDFKPTEEVELCGKKLLVKEGFRLFVLLETGRIADFDPILLTKLIVINNEIDEAKIWKETLEDELILQLNGDSRAVVVEDYLSVGLMSKIYENYRMLNHKMQDFDFLVDDLLGKRFDGIVKISKELDRLTNEINFENEQRISQSQNLQQQQSPKPGSSTPQQQDPSFSESGVLETDLPTLHHISQTDMELFMNFNCYYKVHGMAQLRKTFEPFTQRFLIYQRASEKMEPFLGEGFRDSNGVFFARVKQAVDIFKQSVMSTSRSTQRRNLPQSIILPSEDLQQQQTSGKNINNSINTSIILSEKDKTISKVERVLYYQISNSFPEEKRFLFSVLLTVLDLMDKAKGQESVLLDHIRILLFSETMIPKTNTKTEYSNLKHYRQFNRLFEHVNSFFGNALTTFPELIDFGFDFEQARSQVVALRRKLADQTSKDTTNLARNTSLAEMPGTPGLPRQKKDLNGLKHISDANLRLGSIRINSMIETNALTDSGHSATDRYLLKQLNLVKKEFLRNRDGRGVGRSRRGSLMRTQEKPNLPKADENGLETGPVIEIVFDKHGGLKQPRKVLDRGRAGRNRPRLLSQHNEQQDSSQSWQHENVEGNRKGISSGSNSPVTKRSKYKQSQYSLKTPAPTMNQNTKEVEQAPLIAQKDNETPTTTTITPIGNEQKIKQFQQSKSNTLKNPSIQNSFKKSTPLLKRGKSRGAGSLLKSSLGLKGRLMKSAAKSVITSNKKRFKNRESIQAYSKAYRDYVLDLVGVLLNKEEMQACKNNLWDDFLLGSLSVVAGDSNISLFPKIPVDSRLADKWNVFTFLSFLKYSRPDMMEYALEVTYPEIKSSKYYEVPTTLDSAGRFNWFQKPTLLLYGRMTQDPAELLGSISRRLGIPSVFLEAPSLRIENFETLLEEAAVDGKWIVLKHAQHTPPSLMDQITKLVLKGVQVGPRATSSSSKLKVWILYNLGLDLTVRSYTQGVFSKSSAPSWFPLCLKIFLNPNRNLFQELMGLHSPQVHKLYGSLETGLAREISIMNTGTRQRALKTRKSILLSPPDSEDDQERMVNYSEEVIQICGPEEPTQKAFFYDHEEELRFKLKFVFSSLRQRDNMINELQNSRFKDLVSHHSDAVLNEMIDRVISKAKTGVLEPFEFILKYLGSLMFEEERYSDFQDSRLVFDSFFESAVYYSTGADLKIKHVKESYILPGGPLANRPFADIFNKCLVNYPYKDTPKMFGFSTNEEILTSYSLSKKAFQLLGDFFRETKIGDEKRKYVDSQFLNTLVAVSSGDEDQIIESCPYEGLTYSVEVMKAYEGRFLNGYEASKVLGMVLDSFPIKKFEEIEASLVTMQAEGHAKRTSLTHLDSLSVRQAAQPNSLAIPGASGVQLSNNGLHHSQVGDQRADRLQQNGLFVSKHNIFLEMTQDIESKNEYRRNFLLDEFRKLRKVVDLIERDLAQAKNYLDGEVNHRSKEFSLQTLERFYRNEVPASWLDKTMGFNLKIDNFENFLKSIMIKFDNLYYLAVQLTKLPPILAFDRLLDPGSFIANAALYNAFKYKVSMMNTVMKIYPINTTSNTKQSKKNEKSLAWKITGLKIQGAAIDPETGILREEQKREFKHDLGVLQLEFVQSERTALNFIDGEPSFAVIYESSLEMEEDQERQFEEEIRKTKFRRDLTCQLRLEFTKDTALGKRKLVEKMSYKDGDKDKIYPVRVPISFCPRKNRKKIISPTFYLHCYSLMPQVFWTKKGTFAGVDIQCNQACQSNFCNLKVDLVCFLMIIRKW